MPVLAFDVTRLGSREESIADENLTSAGRRTAAERVASPSRFTSAQKF
jgi:hypothetical protein